MLKIFAGLSFVGLSIYIFDQWLFHGPKANYQYCALALFVLGICLIVSGKRSSARKNNPAPSAQQERRAPQPHAADSSSVAFSSGSDDVHQVSFRVAGVSFDNDDGTSRQTILRKIKFHEPPYGSPDEDIRAEIEETVFDGDLAFCVMLNGYQVGYVPKSKISAVSKALEHYDADVTDVNIYGGGKTSSGEKMSFGCSITLEYSDD